MVESLTYLTPQIKQEVKELVSELRYPDEEAFIREAIEDKIKDLKRKIFFEVTDAIKKDLRMRSISSQEILEDFDKVDRWT